MKLLEDHRFLLKAYANTLKDFIDPEISKYNPIGLEKKPEGKAEIAKQVNLSKIRLEVLLELNMGRGSEHFKLDILRRLEYPEDQLNRNNPGFSSILPVCSRYKNRLDFLGERLGVIFPGHRFYVEDIKVSL